MVTADGHIVIRRYDNNKYWYRCIRVRSIRICTYSLMFSNFRIVYETLVSYTKSRATDCNLTSMSSGFQNRSRKPDYHENILSLKTIRPQELLNLAISCQLIRRLIQKKICFLEAR